MGEAWVNESVAPAAPFAHQLDDELARPIHETLVRLRRIEADVGEKRTDTRERILASALRLFATTGFQATSIRTIAHEVGIKAPGVYSHFDSKEAILSAAVARALGEFLEFVTAPDPNLESAEILEFIVRKHVRFQIANAQVAMPSDSLIANVQFLQEIDPYDRDALRDAQRVYVDVMATAIARHQGARLSQPRTYAHVVITVCDGVNRWYRDGGRLSAAEVEDFIWELVQAAVAS